MESSRIRKLRNIRWVDQIKWWYRDVPVIRSCDSCMFEWEESKPTHRLNIKNSWYRNLLKYNFYEPPCLLPRQVPWRNDQLSVASSHQSTEAMMKCFSTKPPTSPPETTWAIMTKTSNKKKKKNNNYYYYYYNYNYNYNYGTTDNQNQTTQNMFRKWRNALVKSKAAFPSGGSVARADGPHRLGNDGDTRQVGELAARK